MKKLLYVLVAVLLVLMVTFTGCKKESFEKAIVGTYEVTFVKGTESLVCDMIVSYDESTALFTIKLTSGEDFIGQDIIMHGIENEEVIQIQFEEDAYQGLCNVYSGTLQLVDKKAELVFEACGLDFSASEG